MLTANEKYFEYDNKGIKGKLILILEPSEKIKIKIQQNNINYESIFNLKNLKKKNKHFQVCSISEIYDLISKYIEKKNYTLEDTANGITLKIPLEFAFSITEIEFEIINEMRGGDDLIQKLLTEKKDIKTQLNEINKRIDIIMVKLDKLTNNQNIKENNLDKENKINEINNNTENENEKENKDDFENVMKSSKIVDKSGNQIAYIKNWMSPNQKIKCKLLFDGKRDGGQAATFHSFCDNKGPTITFIKTNNKRRIGGFTMKNWDIKLHGNYTSDDKAFLFDLDLNEKYEVNNTSYSIRQDKHYGPTFGAQYNIYIGENFLTDEKSSYYYQYDNSFYKYSSNIKDKNQHFFICEEIEVYQIIFEN